MTGISNKETVWVQYTINNNVAYIITSNKDRATYFLYEYKDNTFVKTSHKSDIPVNLESYINLSQDNKSVKVTNKAVTIVDKPKDVVTTKSVPTKNKSTVTKVETIKTKSTRNNTKKLDKHNKGLF